MTTISSYYGLPGNLEFLDVDVTTDNRLYLDPYAIRLEKGPSPFGRNARKSLDDFFDEIVGCVLSPQSTAQAKGLDLLQHFNEPKETRLGMSKKGINGHGGAGEVGAWIWQVLSTDLRALIGVGVLKRIEHMPIFVFGVDKDITSDLTTRIIFEPLVRFTQAMIEKYPQFTEAPHKTEVVERPVWDRTHHRWLEKELELPIAHNDPLVLIPKHWARGLLLMRSTRYYETSVLRFVQEQFGTVDPKTGKLRADAKRVYKRKRGYGPGAETIRRLTEEAEASNENLVERFEGFARRRYERLDDEEIDRRLSSH